MPRSQSSDVAGSSPEGASESVVYVADEDAQDGGYYLATDTARPGCVVFGAGEREAWEVLREAQAAYDEAVGKADYPAGDPS